VRLNYGNNEALALTKNVSLLGACVTMDKEIVPGTRVALSLDIPRYTDQNGLIGEVKGEGAIVRCDSIQEEGKLYSYELGVFFSNFLPPGEEKLMGYLDHIAQQQEEEIRRWVQQYRAHIKERKTQIAKKKRALARKRAARLAKRAARLAKKSPRSRQKASRKEGKE
jgi:hypothetical protein